MEEKLKGIFSKMLAEKNKKLFIAAGAVGIILVYSSSMLAAKPQSNKQASDSTMISQYCVQQEQRLERILSSIEGVGDAHVMMTLENGVEYRYAADEKQSGDSVFTYSDGNANPSKVQESENVEQNYILIGSSGDKKPLVVTEISPRVKGVVVVCEGGANPITIKRVTDAVTTALGINSLQVCVAKASK